MPNTMGARPAKRTSVILGSSHIEDFIISLLGPYAKKTKAFTIESMLTKKGIHGIAHSPAEASSKTPIRKLIETAMAGRFPAPHSLSHNLTVRGLIRVTKPKHVTPIPIIFTITVIILFFLGTVPSAYRKTTPLLLQRNRFSIPYNIQNQN